MSGPGERLSNKAQDTRQILEITGNQIERMFGATRLAEVSGDNVKVKVTDCQLTCLLSVKAGCKLTNE